MKLSLLTLGFFGLLLLANLPQLALSGQLSAQKDELDDVSFKDLGNIPIVASAKTDKRLFDAPAGAFVFGEQDIASRKRIQGRKFEVIEFVTQKERLRFMLNIEGTEAYCMQMSSKPIQMTTRCV